MSSTSKIVLLFFVLAPFAGLIGRKFGTGVTIMISGSLVGVATIAGSLTTSAFQLALVLMLFAGMK